MSAAHVRSFVEELVRRGHDHGEVASLAERLAAAVERACARLAGLSEPDADLGGYLAGRVDGLRAEASDLAGAFERLEVGDLYLAWACGRGDSAAIAAFERLYFGAARVALARMQLDGSAIDEVLQMVREKLFVVAAGAPIDGPRVLALAGRGDLGTLVRVTAVRLALNLRRDGARVISDDDSDEGVIAALTTAPDPRRLVIAAHERAALRQAIEAAIRGLEPRQRNLVRLHLLHGLSVDEIGTLYRVSRATAARWLAAARGEIERGTRRHLRDELALERSGIDSMLRIVQSSLDVSFERILASASGSASAE